MSSELTYIPGTCNIGPSEIKRRQSVAYLGAVLTIITTIALLAAHTSHLSHIAVFIPAMIFSVGLVQSTKKFCFAFGLIGVFNLGALGKVERVGSKEARAADRTMALVILFQSTVIAFLISAIVVIL